MTIWRSNPQRKQRSIPRKYCPICKETKLYNEFYDNHRMSDGKSSYCIECSRKKSLEYCHEVRETKPMSDNKECPLYLGVYIAERVLSKVFKHTKRMPNNNPGYDFICNKGYKIDVKSATINSQRRWHFNIKQNDIPDYFLLIAFNNRDDLEPKHLWLIPGNVINDKTGVSIYETSIDKWSEYELCDKLDQTIACCETLRT